MSQLRECQRRATTLDDLDLTICRIGATIELRERESLQGRRWTQCLREAGRSVQCLGLAEDPQVYRCAAVRYCARNRIDTIADSRRSGKSYAIYKPVRVTTYGSIPGLHGPSETHRREQV